MFRYELLRNEWIILVLFAGTAMVFYLVLFYLDFWKPREKDEKSGEYRENYLSVFEGIPWALKVTIFLIVVIMTTYAIIRVIDPKSW